MRKTAVISALCLPSLVLAETLQLTSPDGALQLNVSDDAGEPEYWLSFEGETVIERSPLGLAFGEQGEFGPGFTISGQQRNTADTTWRQPWGERERVRDHHNALVVDFAGEEAGRFSVHFKLFDDGLGFRYEVPEQDGMDRVNVVDERTEFRVPDPGETTAWWIPSRGWNRYEYIYNTTPLSSLDRAHTPFTFRLPSGTHLSIHEAALTEWAAMTLDQRRPGQLKADLTPWSDGIRVKTAAPFTSSWRTIQVAGEATGLLNSDLILNLNEPNQLGDVDWVQPGKYVGIWWGMHIRENTWGSGPTHGATTENTKAYMDFAASYGFDGVLVEGWNVGWDGDWYNNGDIFSFTKPYDDFDIEEISRYGLEKGVRLIGHHETSGSVSNYHDQMADAFDLYARLGVRQVKTGYVADGGNIKRVDEQGRVRHEWHDGQYMVGEYLHNVREAARRKISINTHEPIKDTGLRRTWPNWLAREGARGQEYNAWGSPPNPPEHIPMLAFTRMLSGPMDFTPGIFDLGFNGLDGENRPQTTLTKQLAAYVVLYSPIQMAADLPENYLQRSDAFQFIRDVPTDWEESIAVAGEVAEFVVFARQERDGQDWYLGAVTDHQPRTVTVSLDFLDGDTRYQAQIYRDGPEAHWRDNPYDYEIETRPVSSADSLEIRMAASGGMAVRFKALD